ncbi:MAG: 3-isopropylmalate dehydrogenase [Candidatus Acidiferrales bacterium]
MIKVKKTIVLLPGDGIGPEVTSAAAAVLRDCASELGHDFALEDYPVGGTAIDGGGSPLPEETLNACREADAVLLGAVGGPRWDALPLDRRPESGLLRLRKELNLYINLRPIFLREPLSSLSPLAPARRRHIDLEIVRELAGGIYFGEHRTERRNGHEKAFDVEAYSTAEVERVARFAFGRAVTRRKRLTSVDKANVLATSVLWRKTVEQTAGDFSDVAVGHMYVDNAAMQLVLAPEQFDVLLTSNMFGDILSDAAAGLVGSIGLIPSMSCGEGTPLFEPIHGSAPQLAGKDSACPIGAILSATMLLREAFGLATEADWIEAALDRALVEGYRTADLAESGATVVGCSEFTQRVRDQMRRSVRQFEPYGWGV